MCILIFDFCIYMNLQSYHIYIQVLSLHVELLCLDSFIFPSAIMPLSQFPFLFFFLQLVSMQNEMQKQMAMMVAVPVTKEGKRLEAALGRSMEKAVKANSDALWARLQEENAKQEKAAKERMQQLTNTISNCLNKDLPAIIEKTVKRELATIGQAVARAISPAIDKTISASIVESFQVKISVFLCFFFFNCSSNHNSLVFCLIRRG